MIIYSRKLKLSTRKVKAEGLIISSVAEDVGLWSTHINTNNTHISITLLLLKNQ